MKKRMLCLVTALVMLVMALSACGEDGFVPSGHLRLKGKDIPVDWVLRLDGKDVSADEFRYFYMNVVFERMLAAQGEMDWTEEDDRIASETAVEYIVLNDALFDLAESYGITVDEADMRDIKKTVSETRAGYASDEEFVYALALNFIAEEYYPELLESTVIQEKLSEHLVGEDGIFAITDGEMLQKVEEEYVCVRYLKLGPDAEGSTENRDKMAGYAASVKDADDLITLINLYSEEVSMKNNPDGRYVTDGLVSDELLAAVRALKVGEISPVISCEDGYFMALRLPVDVEYVDANIGAFKNVYYEKLVEQLLTEECADTVVEYNSEIYGKINIWDME